MKKITAIVCGALMVGLFFGYLLGLHTARFDAPVAANISGASTSVASLMIDYGDGSVRVYPDLIVRPGESLLSLLEEQARQQDLQLTTKDFKDLGILVESIGTKTNGDDGKYWQYWVNNTAIPYAASKYQVQPGDVIEWKFLNYH